MVSALCGHGSGGTPALTRPADRAGPAAVVVVAGCANRLRHDYRHHQGGWLALRSCWCHPGGHGQGAPRELPHSTPVAFPAAGPAPDQSATTGSLWTSASSSFYQDLKAKRVGDVLTITVRENSDASKQASTNTGRSRDNSADASFAGLTAGNTNVLGPAKTGYSAKFDNNFKGSGVTTKTDKMTAYMTATVVDILPNGNLFIRGARWTKVNEELQQIVLEGVVRPTDINRHNEILSQKIGDAKIFFVGKGPVSTQQRPGWLGQLFDIINPF